MQNKPTSNQTMKETSKFMIGNRFQTNFKFRIISTYCECETKVYVKVISIAKVKIKRNYFSCKL
jgi:hypothetical protein